MKLILWHVWYDLPFAFAMSKLYHTCQIRRKLYGRETSANISFKMGGEKPCKSLQISIENFCTFPWCIDTELSFSHSSRNIEDLSSCVILRAPSYIRFILLLSPLLWNIHIRRQYPNLDSTKAFIVFLLCFKSMNGAIGQEHKAFDLLFYT